MNHQKHIMNQQFGEGELPHRTGKGWEFQNKTLEQNLNVNLNKMIAWKLSEQKYVLTMHIFNKIINL